MTGRGVTVVVVDDGVEHTIKDIQPNYVSAGSTVAGARAGWRLGEVARACERSAAEPGLGQGGKCQPQTFPWEVLHPSGRVTSLCAA